jgi:hypothetical protein
VQAQHVPAARRHQLHEAVVAEGQAVQALAVVRQRRWPRTPS